MIGVVVAHGAMADGLISAVRRIAGGQADALVPLSNDGADPEQLKSQLDDLVADRPAVVFTDLAAGSCTLAARLACRECAHVPVVTGVNLPMLLDFVFHLEDSPTEVAQRVAGKAVDGVRVTAPAHS